MRKANWLVFAAAAWISIAPARQASAQDLDPNKTPPLENLNTGLEQPEPQQDAAPNPSLIFRPQATVITPRSSVSAPGKGVHTNYKVLAPAGHAVASAVPDYTFAETPASMGCVYGVGPNYSGCKPSSGLGKHPGGGWGAIALVDAYDDPNAAADLAYFDRYYDVPAANFQVVYANSSFGELNGLTASCSGTPPPADLYGWDLEEALDIEWSHVMAPNAKIILVEACSQSLPDLMFAEQVAGIEVGKNGGGDVSNSWGIPESEIGNPGDGGGTLSEQENDNFIFRYNWSDITYFASAGDAGAEVLYPSASPWVVSAGGTTVNRDSSGNFLSESCWADSGGGFSTVEGWANPPNISNGMGPWSDAQYLLFGAAPYEAPFRSTPDISFNADPNSGVYVYDSESGGWIVVGGTSVSSPALAGIVNASNNRLGMASSKAGGYYQTSELNLLYSQLPTNAAYHANFYDVTAGTNGHAAGTGYDQCTGIGSPRGHSGK